MEGEGEAAAREMDTGQRVAAAIFTGGMSELFGMGESSENELARIPAEGGREGLGVPRRAT